MHGEEKAAHGIWDPCKLCGERLPLRGADSHTQPGFKQPSGAWAEESAQVLSVEYVCLNQVCGLDASIPL